LDYEWCKERIEEYDLPNKCKILMSVVNGKHDPARLCEMIINDGLDVRFQLQLHKYIWPEDEKGR
jgi:7-carboxy-7-deazaguanine synthase